MFRITENCMGLNHFWARLLIEELVRCGVRRFCFAPGGQSTPLVVAASEHPDVQTVVHLDERGAAFFALGQGRATGEPAVVVSTSGTAVANFYPAVVEAFQARDPLLLLTGDLPGECADTGINQAIDQSRIFGDFLKWRVDFPAPDEGFSAAHLLSAIDQAVYQSKDTAPGPVHLNCRFRKPLLEPKRKRDFALPTVLTHWAANHEPYTTYFPGAVSAGSEDATAAVISRIAAAKRGLILVGQLPSHYDACTIAQLAETLGWPLLAESTSGLRSSAARVGEGIFAHFPLYLGSPLFAETSLPDVVLHFGGDLVLHVQGAPVNNCVNEYLSRSGADYFHVQDHPFRQDPLLIVRNRIQADPAQFAKQLLTKAAPSRSELLSAFVHAEKVSQQILSSRDAVHEELSELGTVRDIAKEIGSGHGLFIANSLPIRMVDAYVPILEKHIAIASHHGVKGIDGTIAAASGFAAARGAACTVLLGDLAFLHDVNSIPLLKKCSWPLTLVVLNNDGGSIFSYVVGSETEQFETFFLTPHGLHFDAAASLYGVAYHRPQSRAAFRELYQAAVAAKTSSIIEIVVPRERLLREQEEIYRLVAESLKE